MDLIYRWGVDVILQLQRMPIFVNDPFTYFWILSTKLGDPATIFTLHAPLLYIFIEDVSVFVKFFLASCVSEFLNGVFKWALMADRPYWWIQTTNIEGLSELTLKQFPPTCETGPGSPSGHCMVTASAWIILVLSRNSRFSRFVATLTFLLALTVLALSRLYIGTHFPHQVIFGAAVGSAVGAICYRIRLSSFGLRFCLKLVLALVLTAIVTYKTLYWLEYDPDWSIELAERYCQNKNWIHLTTTPFGSLFRDVGALIGLGMVAELSNSFIRSKYRHFKLKNRILGLIFSLAVTQSLTQLPILDMSHSLTWFYICIAVKHATLVFCYTFVVPTMLSLR